MKGKLFPLSLNQLLGRVFALRVPTSPIPYLKYSCIKKEHAISNPHAVGVDLAIQKNAVTDLGIMAVTTEIIMARFDSTIYSIAAEIFCNHCIQKEIQNRNDKY